MKIVKSEYVAKEELYGKVYTCPKCGKDDVYEFFNYCPMCGEKVEWIEEDTCKDTVCQ